MSAPNMRLNASALRYRTSPSESRGAEVLGQVSLGFSANRKAEVKPDEACGNAASLAIPYASAGDGHTWGAIPGRTGVGSTLAVAGPAAAGHPESGAGAQGAGSAAGSARPLLPAPVPPPQQEMEDPQARRSPNAD